MSKRSRAIRRLDPRRVRIAQAMAQYEKQKQDAQKGIEVKVSEVEEVEKEESTGVSDQVREVPENADQTGCASIQPSTP